MQNTILLVDDESDIREVLSLPLCDLGYRVSEAETGNQALEIFRELQPAIVLTDIKMPGMDGIELLQKIKHENPETSDSERKGVLSEIKLREEFGWRWVSVLHPDNVRSPARIGGVALTLCGIVTVFYKRRKQNP